MAYNLPPAWDPGFVLPSNVEDEGLERRAFITKWMPRGTYDNPTVGTGGFVVPKYIQAEGYGQGTYTTKWQPSGTYSGPGVPNWLNRRPQLVGAKPARGGGQQVTIQPMGDDAPLPAAYQDYGQRAAQVLLASIAPMPQQRQAAALRAIMNKIDPSLWNRTQAIFQRYVKQGTAPSNALPMALARAMSAGIAAEIVNTGLRGSAPQAKSLLGLGCYGCMAALGAVDIRTLTNGPIFSGGSTGTRVATTNTTSAPAQTTDANGCTVTAGFSWVYGTNINGKWVGGHWERTAAGATDMPFCPNGPPPPGATTVTVVPRDHTTQGVQVSPLEDFSAPFYFRPDTPVGTVRNHIGPGDITVMGPDVPDEVFQKYARIANMHVIRDIPQPWLDWMKQSITTPAEWRTPKFKYDPSLDAVNAPDAAPFIAYWYSRMGIAPGTQIYTEDAGEPQARVTWPIDGSTLGLNWGMDLLFSAQPASPDNPRVVKFWIGQIPDKSAGDEVEHFFSRLYDAAKEALDNLGDLACKVFSGSKGQAAGAAASTAIGVGPTVGAAGAAIAQQSCNTPPPAPTLVPTSSLLPVAIIGGGALLAVLLLSRRTPP